MLCSDEHWSAEEHTLHQTAVPVIVFRLQLLVLGSLAFADVPVFAVLLRSSALACMTLLLASCKGIVAYTSVLCLQHTWLAACCLAGTTVQPAVALARQVGRFAVNVQHVKSVLVDICLPAVICAALACNASAALHLRCMQQVCRQQHSSASTAEEPAACQHCNMPGLIAA